MADDDSTPFYATDRRVGVPRKQAPGIEVWRLHHDGHVQSCELRDDSRADAGWDVQVLENGEPLSRVAASTSEALAT